MKETGNLKREIFSKPILDKCYNKPMKSWWSNLDEMWQWIIGIPVVLVAIILTGVVYRVATGSPAIPKKTETSQDRNSRLQQCAEAESTTVTQTARLDGDYQGVCKGFTEDEIQQAIDNQ